MFLKWFEKAVVEGREQKIEIRKEELWNRRCRIMEWAGLESKAHEDFNEMTIKQCIFCTPHKVAKFDRNYGKELYENEYAFLFPNLNPYAQYSGVCAFKQHYIRLDDFTATLLRKNFELCSEYLKKIIEVNSKIKYASLNWNYMMPAGASILHPHLQIIADMHPTTYMDKLLDNEDLFKEYLQKELDSERFVFKLRKTEVFTPFVPFGFNEFVGVTKEDLVNALEDIPIALEKILSYYASIGRNSFNLSLYMSIDNRFPLHFRAITRQNMSKYYRNDAMYFERLHNEIILEKTPERVSEDLRTYLGID